MSFPYFSEGAELYKTDKQGDCVFLHAMAWPCNVEISCAGYQPFATETKTLQTKQELTFTLKQARSIRGTVLSPDGKPASEANIHVWRRVRKGSEQTWDNDASADGMYGPKTTTDPQGRFFFDSCLDDDEYCVVVVAKGVGYKKRIWLSVDTDNTIRLEPELTIEGEIHNALKNVDMPDSVQSRHTSCSNGKSTPITYKDGIGRFAIRGLLPGRYEIQLGKDNVCSSPLQLNGAVPDEKTKRRYVIEATVDPKHPHAKVTFDLSKPPVPLLEHKRLVRFHFTTLDGGSPHGTIHIRAINPDSSELVELDPIVKNGQAVIEMETPRTFTYSPKGLLGYWFKESKDSMLPDGEKPLDISVDLTPAGAIACNILASDGSQIDGCFFKENEARPTPETLGVYNGFSFKPFGGNKLFCNPLPLGKEYVIVFTQPAATAVAVTKPIRLDHEHPMQTATVQFPPTRSVSGQVIDVDGRPAAGVAVIPVFQHPVTLQEVWCGGGQKTDSQGRFKFTGLSSGIEGYFLMAVASSTNNHAVVRLPAEGQTATIRLRPMKTIEGRVIDKKNQPVSHARLCIVSESSLGCLSSYDEARADCNGRFHVSCDSDRLYRITAHFRDVAAGNNERDEDRSNKGAHVRASDKLVTIIAE